MNTEFEPVEIIDQDVEINSPELDKEAKEHSQRATKTLKEGEEKKPYSLTVASFNQYMLNNLVTDFTQLPFHHKLTALQVLPSGMVRKRVIGSAGGRNIEAEYIPHEVAERALNFIFNFNVSQEIIRTEFEEFKEEGMKKNWSTGAMEKKTSIIYEALAEVKFTFITDTGTRITRTVISTHKGYKNPATSRKSVVSGAVSKSWSLVAKTFGIGSNINRKEEDAYEQIRNAYASSQPAEQNVATGKAFANPIDINPNY